MKKFTFIAMLMLILCGVAKADDKYFFKVPTDKMASGWVIQDAGNFVSTPGKEYLEVKNNKNGGRMLNYFWNEDAWTKSDGSKIDVNSLPNSTYKFTMDLNMSNMAARSDMEFDLLPVNACTATDSRVSSHNYHWFNNEGEDYFFRFRVASAPAAANGDFTILINENPTARDNWPTEAENSCVLSSQKTYKFAVVVNAAEKTATYTITAADDGTQVATGVHKYVCEENRVGIFVFSMNGNSTHQLSNIGLSYEANGPFANEPTSELLAARKAERDYYVTFTEGEVLHWVQLGNAVDAFGNAYEDGQEYSVAYGEANDTRDFEADPDEYFGSKIIFCTKSGDLKMWTSREEDETNVSENVVLPVTCEILTMPTPVATITNVEEGYAKEYTLTVDNSTTLLTPTVTIHYVVKDAAGNVKEQGDEQSGKVVKLADAGSLEIYGFDGTHADPWYNQSETVVQQNNAEYVKATFTNYAWSKADCDGTMAGFTKTEIIDNANKSHWDRIYSDQKYGYDENGNASAWADGTDYAWVKSGFGFYEGTSIGSDDAKWNVQKPVDVTTAFAPLAPTADFMANSKYVASAWGIFPLEGIVYYDTNVTNAVLQLDPKYTSDDASKPNFYIVHTRGGYDRPDKGDCNKNTVCVAGENYSLYRYDTAICDVTVMTYKGFVPGTGTGISSVNAAETVAPTVKKVATKNGIVIVKGDKVYSVTGAQIK